MECVVEDEPVVVLDPTFNECEEVMLYPCCRPSQRPFNPSCPCDCCQLGTHQFCHVTRTALRQISAEKAAHSRCYEMAHAQVEEDHNQ
jgi:hypothetical protein